ncbi:HAMP domain-containing histidine kinase [Agromyces intestinalis]|uniref:histidine kinase n=1 Tax=Agromyces intestinalis TaxID=2592652 RepID=A0A5C1YJJ7_9MICO|nr:HAMP domain-containing sensor histidine kinase [Agromyces intestinalis]QEO15319.1 HAMP domain-containing histidine kinase [Agromyces intestinalis]
MHQTLSERWNRISLRTKITGVTVLVLTLGLLVSGIGTAAMLRGYVESQMEAKLRSIAGGSLEKYFESSGEGEGSGDGDDDWAVSLGKLDFRDSDDVFVAVYRTDGTYRGNNWSLRARDELPQIPRTLTLIKVLEINDGDYRILELPDGAGHPSFRAIVSLQTADQPGHDVPVLIAISTVESERLLAAYLTIFFGFGFGVVLIGALLTRMLVTSTFAPLREVERTAAAIADGDFSQRLGGATPNTEVGRLNRSLNTMLNRIDRAFRDRARTIDQMRRFVGDASHELRTPLVSVRGYAELYRMGALQTPEEVAQAMDRIEKEAVRMGGLVEDLLALARLDEAKPLELAEVDLVPLARDAALDTMAAHPDRKVTVIAPGDGGEGVRVGAVPALAVDLEPDAPRGTRAGGIAFAGATLARLRGRRLRDQGGKRGVAGSTATGAIAVPAGAGASGDQAPGSASAPVTGANSRPQIATDAPSELVRPAIVLAEENKIRQVLTNLVANAIRFTHEGSPLEIRVSVDDAADRATFEVIDHGEGIPPQIREKIFQRFWRADTSRTRETGGSGLGLAIVSSIVAAHNGTVDVVETPGGGATFRISLPLAGSPSAPQPVG